MNIKKLREAKGWTQLDLAIRANVSPDTIAKAEIGRRVPTLATISRVAKALGMTIDQVIDSK